MSKLVIEHREIEAQIKSQQSTLASIEQNPDYAKELAFADALDGLMTEYRKSLRDIISILDPESNSYQKERQPRGPAPGTPRVRRKYRNPHTNEVVETASGNNSTLKKWKNENPGVNIKEWIIGDAQ